MPTWATARVAECWTREVGRAGRRGSVFVLQKVGLRVIVGGRARSTALVLNTASQGRRWSCRRTVDLADMPHGIGFICCAEAQQGRSQRDSCHTEIRSMLASSWVVVTRLFPSLVLPLPPCLYPQPCQGSSSFRADAPQVFEGRSLGHGSSGEPVVQRALKGVALV